MNTQLKPLVSVIMPTFNHERYIKDAIVSIINQTYQNLELIVINDGSVDRTENKLFELSERCSLRFVTFQYFYQENQGISNSLNRAIRLAKGKYIFLMATDDVAREHAISTLVNELEVAGSAYAAACGDSQFIDSDGQPFVRYFDGQICYNNTNQAFTSFITFQTRSRKHLRIKQEPLGSYESFLLGNYISVGPLIRKEYLYDVGLYDNSCMLEDLDMWLKLTKCFKILLIEEPLFFYRVHGSNVTIKSSKNIKRSHIDLLKKEKQYCYSTKKDKIWNLGYLLTLSKRPRNLGFFENFKNINCLDTRSLNTYLFIFILHEILRLSEIIRCSITRNLRLNIK